MPAGHYVALAVGGSHACALTEEGEAACWNSYTYQGSAYDPEIVPPGRYTAISASEHRTCAITEQGGVVCWGDANYEEWPLSGL